MIVDDKVNIGFSLRALGSVQPMSDGTLMVKDPIMPITYDVVSNPSHANARIMEFIPESDTSMFESADSIIIEGTELELLEEDQIQICEGGVCVRNFISDVVADRFLEVVSKKVKFSI